ncbi:uncharacterized protein K452DRAFT_292798 [Aplosporella prunicola CBS 121167]|uniref:Uncharacterized protein n=1 Tax=Aplosporella prunicola CBS 121167 TaxID=1176127 RepID=A0A6A6AZQ1_9PEZI|nr:uncharacterized protein K452DRAFT_292798 [Aplosporella prunicola CBS 121167]KAF2135941.1 hypothetical protein K452DRAFT_292798 [Aplosporella prunicola CBS 121167]
MRKLLTPSCSPHVLVWHDETRVRSVPYRFGTHLCTAESVSAANYVSQQLFCVAHLVIVISILHLIKSLSRL